MRTTLIQLPALFLPRWGLCRADVPIHWLVSSGKEEEGWGVSLISFQV
jgi:hypothetical protein